MRLDIVEHLHKLPLIIVTKGELVHHMLASCLRDRMIHGIIPFPILMTLSGLEEEGKIVKEFIDENKVPFCNVFSLSATEEERIAIANNLGKGCRQLSAAQFLSFFQLRSEYFHKSTEPCVLGKHITVQLRRPDLLHSLDDLDSYVCDISLSNYKLPFRKILTNEEWSNRKLSSEGFRVITSGNQDENINLTLPNIDDFIHSLLIRKNIRARDTDVRKRAKAVSSYFNNFWEIDIYSTIEVQKVFFELKDRLLREPLSIDEVGIGYGDICRIMKTVPYGNKIPDNVIMHMVSGLINKKILFRGTVIQCPNCFLKEWKFLGQLQNKIVCEGCSEEFFFPHVDHTRWKYRLNRLFMEGFDITVFLTLMREVGFKQQDSDKVVGYNFGFKANLRKNGEMRTRLGGMEEIEVDLAIIENGRFSIGECKQNPKEFTDEVVKNVIEFANYIGCDRVLFSSIGDLQNLREMIPPRRRRGYPEIAVLDQNDLLYLTAYLHGLLERAQITQRGRGIELRQLETRRNAFFDQYSLVAKSKREIKDAIGEYFEL